MSQVTTHILSLQNNDERNGFVKIMNVDQYIQFGVVFFFSINLTN